MDSKSSEPDVPHGEARPSSGANTRLEQPFPGLRPFEPYEANLFFGREEQCDELLARLARRRMVAVVGVSGSGKSSLVRAGLIPSLERGDVPAAGVLWQIAICRPGTDPLGNLTQGLAFERIDGRVRQRLPIEQLRATLETSSLGLAAAGRELLRSENAESLLIVVDQFEEIFRFRRIGGVGADEDAAEFVKLLIGAAEAHDSSIYVVLTMRSDYLGDCAQFVGLPEALNDGQFLVPQMTRDQIREAIEGPIAVAQASITPRLVQRLLHDVESVAFADREPDSRQKDPLPLLQHTLMRVWKVSAESRKMGHPIDSDHYEHADVQTINHALDRHAEEAFNELSPDERQIAKLAFQRLTESDLEGRGIRRPTSLAEVAAVGLRLESAPAPKDLDRVLSVLMRFSADGRSFLVRDAQDTFDISHESLIRQWKRLSGWVEAEAVSKRKMSMLAETAVQWRNGKHWPLRGPELSDVLSWWRVQQPTWAWARRYTDNFALAASFLGRSVTFRSLVRVATLLGVLALVSMAVYIEIQRQQNAKLEVQITQITQRLSTNDREIEMAQARSEAEAQRRLQQTTAESAQQAAQRVQAERQLAELQAERSLLEQAQAAALRGEQQKADELTAQANRVVQEAEERRQAERDELDRQRQTLESEVKKLTEANALLAKQKEDAETLLASITSSSPTPTDPVPPISSGSASPSSGQSTGSAEKAFYEGVVAFVRRDWRAVINYMTEAIRLQGNRTMNPVLISGNQFQEWTPYSYLAAAYAQLENWCMEATEALQRAALEKGAGVGDRLKVARARCGVQVR